MSPGRFAATSTHERSEAEEYEVTKKDSPPMALRLSALNRPPSILASMVTPALIAAIAPVSAFTVSPAPIEILATAKVGA
ncbi:unannotated protein [freshwater metagenome]|uniref:Unannotated protein n=1 Tax=freshwater metagenome TaxID=449393 RepID=A0A6J7KW21_9ZZZZ